MKNRLHRRSTEEIERALLSTGRRVASPDPDALERTLARVERNAIAGLLGTAAGAYGTSAAGSDASAAVASTASAAGGAAGVGTGAIPMLLGKWLAVGAAAGLLSVGTAAVVRGPAPGPARPARVTGTTDRDAHSNARGPSAQPVSPAMSSAAAPDHVSRPTRGSRTVAVPEARAGISPELAAELALLDAARAALERGDHEGALAWLDRHEKSFPRGQLAPEAAMLRHKTLSHEGGR